MEVLEEINIEEWLKSKPSKSELCEKYWELVEEESVSAVTIASELLRVSELEGWEYTLLHEACELDNVDVLKTLIETGFDKNAYSDLKAQGADNYGTPLTKAIESSAEDCIKFLLSFDDLDVTTCGYCKYSETPSWASGLDVVPFNELFETSHLDRVVELGASPSDCDQEDSLLWKAYETADIEMFKKLVNLGADLNIDTENGYLIEQVLAEYLLKDKQVYLPIFRYMVKAGANLTVPCIELRSIIHSVLDSNDEALLKVLGLNKSDMEGISETYEKPLPNYPYELLHEDFDSDDVLNQVFGALMDGHYGWKEAKLTRIINMAISIFEEDHGEDIPFSNETDHIWANLEQAQVNSFLKRGVSDLESYEREFKNFLSYLEEQGKLDNPSKCLKMGLNEITYNIKKLKNRVGSLAS